MIAGRRAGFAQPTHTHGGAAVAGAVGADSPPQNPPASHAAARRMLLLLAAVLWHVALFGLTRPTERPLGYRPTQATRVSVLPLLRSDENGMTAAEARALWSPILLSLPSSIGFSATLGSGQPRTAPALDLPREEIQFLSNARGGTPTPLASPRALWMQSQTEAHLTRPLAAPERRTGALSVRPPNEATIHVAFLAGAGAEDVRRPEWPERVLEQQARAWEATIQAWGDHDGVVHEVLLEIRTDDRDLNAALVQAVYGWTLQPTAPTNWLRVRVRSFGSPWTAGSATGTAP